MRLKIVALLAVIQLAFCYFDQTIVLALLSFQERMHIILLVGKNSTEKIFVDNDVPFFIELPSSPTTGYKWAVDASTLKNIQHVDNELTGNARLKKGLREGLPAVQTFTFLPIEVGKETIVFRYERPWEKDVEPTTYTVYVDVYQGGEMLN